jgi:uncharacterized protein YndB with AHSA1/START domain/predicted enzyme related to lactoylglutathione lyase
MSTKLAPEPVATLRVSRLIKAPRERVFDAWTNPAEIPKWFGPATCSVQSVEMDLRVGGAYHYRVSSEARGTMDLHGRYQEIKRPSRLVYTWTWKNMPDLEFGETLVTVDFLDKEGFTEVQITHDRLPTKEQRENHSHGWNGCLDKLENHFGGSQASCSDPGTFCWNELLTTDTAGATGFYTKLFGWKTEAFAGPTKYTLFTQNGAKVAGLMQRPCEDMPPHWLAYVEVKSVDESLAQASGLGAKVLMPAMDIPTVGRIAVVQDPQGAAFGMFQPALK